MEFKNKNLNVKEKKHSMFKKAINKVLNKDDGEFTAEKAWLYSTYSTSTKVNIDERIASKQKSIIEAIKSKFHYTNGNYDNHSGYSSYRCIIDIEEDLIAHTDIILKPFIENGFKVINLSECVSEIKDETVYLISWKNVFNTNKKS